MERESDEEQLVTDLEYISTNVVMDDNNNMGVVIPTYTIPTDLLSRYILEDDTSSEMSEDEITNSPKLKTFENLEDGELSYENEVNLGSNNAKLSNIVDDSHLRDIYLDKDTNIVRFGSITNVVENTIVVKAINNGGKIVDVGTAVFLDNKNYIGEIYDIFGPIELPFYSIVVKKTFINKVEEGLKVFYADKSNTVVFVDMNKLNKIDDGVGVEDENDTQPSNSQPSYNNQRKRNRMEGKQQNIQNQTYLNAWPPSMKTLKNSYDVRTFYKHGQWPASFENNHQNK